MLVLRMMAVFEKGERLRHIGHLDIQRAMQRALRRSGLPVRYSQGFNPHILVTFASALSTGAAGKRELMDVTLEREVAPEAFLAEMNAALPPDMRLVACRTLDDRHPALMSMLAAADYTLKPLDEAAEKCAAAIPALLEKESVLAMRKTKRGLYECDIRPLIYELREEEGSIRAVLDLTESTSCKPDMLMSALSELAGCEAPRTLVIRNGLLGRDEKGMLQPLETL